MWLGIVICLVEAEPEEENGSLIHTSTLCLKLYTESMGEPSRGMCLPNWTSLKKGTVVCVK